MFFLGIGFDFIDRPTELVNGFIAIGPTAPLDPVNRTEVTVLFDKAGFGL